ncbi:hypothetical protein HK102_000379 [Quaeritorhiza haematococci]|nr:hypothetical protein HK102_000379 [Quaeritorhiza haematococci]
MGEGVVTTCLALDGRAIRGHHECRKSLTWGAHTQGVVRHEKHTFAAGVIHRFRSLRSHFGLNARGWDGNVGNGFCRYIGDNIPALPFGATLLASPRVRRLHSGWFGAYASEQGGGHVNADQVKLLRKLDSALLFGDYDRAVSAYRALRDASASTTTDSTTSAEKCPKVAVTDVQYRRLLLLAKKRMTSLLNTVSQPIPVGGQRNSNDASITVFEDGAPPASNIHSWHRVIFSFIMIVSDARAGGIFVQKQCLDLLDICEHVVREHGCFLSSFEGVDEGVPGGEISGSARTVFDADVFEIGLCGQGAYLESMGPFYIQRKVDGGNGVTKKGKDAGFAADIEEDEIGRAVDMNCLSTHLLTDNRFRSRLMPATSSDPVSTRSKNDSLLPCRELTKFPPQFIRPTHNQRSSMVGGSTSATSPPPADRRSSLRRAPIKSNATRELVAALASNPTTFQHAMNIFWLLPSWHSNLAAVHHISEINLGRWDLNPKNGSRPANEYVYRTLMAGAIKSYYYCARREGCSPASDPGSTSAHVLGRIIQTLWNHMVKVQRIRPKTKATFMVAIDGLLVASKSSESISSTSTAFERALQRKQWEHTKQQQYLPASAQAAYEISREFRNWARGRNLPLTAKARSLVLQSAVTCHKWDIAVDDLQSFAREWELELREQPNSKPLEEWYLYPREMWDHVLRSVLPPTGGLGIEDASNDGGYQDVKVVDVSAFTLSRRELPQKVHRSATKRKRLDLALGCYSSLAWTKERLLSTPWEMTYRGTDDPGAGPTARPSQGRRLFKYSTVRTLIVELLQAGMRREAIAIYLHACASSCVRSKIQGESPVESNLAREFLLPLYVPDSALSDLAIQAAAYESVSKSDPESYVCCTLPAENDFVTAVLGNQRRIPAGVVLSLLVDRVRLEVMLQPSVNVPRLPSIDRMKHDEVLSGGPTVVNSSSDASKNFEISQGSSIVLHQLDDYYYEMGTLRVTTWVRAIAALLHQKRLAEADKMARLMFEYFFNRAALRSTLDESWLTKTAESSGLWSWISSYKSIHSPLTSESRVALDQRLLALLLSRRTATTLIEVCIALCRAEAEGGGHQRVSPLRVEESQSDEKASQRNVWQSKMQSIDASTYDVIRYVQHWYMNISELITSYARANATVRPQADEGQKQLSELHILRPNLYTPVFRSSVVVPWDRDFLSQCLSDCVSLGPGDDAENGREGSSDSTSNSSEFSSALDCALSAMLRIGDARGAWKAYTLGGRKQISSKSVVSIHYGHHRRLVRFDVFAMVSVLKGGGMSPEARTVVLDVIGHLHRIRSQYEQQPTEALDVDVIDDHDDEDAFVSQHLNTPPSDSKLQKQGDEQFRAVCWSLVRSVCDILRSHAETADEAGLRDDIDLVTALVNLKRSLDPSAVSWTDSNPIAAFDQLEEWNIDAHSFQSTSDDNAPDPALQPLSSLYKIYYIVVGTAIFRGHIAFAVSASSLILGCGVEPHRETFITLLGRLADSGDVRNSVDLLCQLVRAGKTPDAIANNLAAKAFVKARRAAEGVGFLRGIGALGGGTMISSGPKNAEYNQVSAGDGSVDMIDRWAWNTVLWGLARELLKERKRTLDMQRQSTFASSSTAASKDGNGVYGTFASTSSFHAPPSVIEQVMPYVAEMVGNGYGVDVVTFTGLLGVCESKEEIEVVRKWAGSCGIMGALGRGDSLSSCATDEFSMTPIRSSNASQPEDREEQTKVISFLDAEDPDGRGGSFRRRRRISGSIYQDESPVEEPREASKRLPVSQHVDLKWYNALISAYARAREPEEAELVFRDVFETPTANTSPVVHEDHESRIKPSSSTKAIPDVMTINSLMNAWAKVGEYGRALRLFEHFMCLDEEGSICPDTYTFNILIDAAIRCKALEPVEKLVEVHRWYKKMTQWTQSPKDRISTCALDCTKTEVNRRPDVVTFNLLIRAAAEAANPELAQALFEEMRKLACRPTERTWAELVRAYANAGDVGGAVRRFEMMEKNLSGTTEAGLQGENFPVASINPSVTDRPTDVDALQTTYQTLMKIWADKGDAESVISWISKAHQQSNVELTATMWSHLVKAYIIRGDLELAESVAEGTAEVLEQVVRLPEKETPDHGQQERARMRQKPQPPTSDPVLWNMLINAWCERKEYKRAISLVGRIPPHLVDVVTVGAVMKLCLHARWSQEADAVWNWVTTGSESCVGVKSATVSKEADLNSKNKVLPHRHRCWILTSRPRPPTLQGPNESTVCCYLDTLGVCGRVGDLRDTWLQISDPAFVTAYGMGRSVQHLKSESGGTPSIASSWRAGGSRWPTENAYNSLIEALLRCDKHQEAVDVFLMMARNCQSKPDITMSRDGSLPHLESTPPPSAKTVRTLCSPLIRDGKTDLLKLVRGDIERFIPKLGPVADALSSSSQ